MEKKYLQLSLGDREKIAILNNIGNPSPVILLHLKCFRKGSGDGGDINTLNFTVRNAGTGRMQSASPLQVQACIDEDETPECGTWNDATPIPATTVLQNLDAAAVASYTYSYRIPVNTTRGNKTLRVRINNNNNPFPEVNAESTSNTDENTVSDTKAKY